MAALLHTGRINVTLVVMFSRISFVAVVVAVVGVAAALLHTGRINVTPVVMFSRTSFVVVVVVLVFDIDYYTSIQGQI